MPCFSYMGYNGFAYHHSMDNNRGDPQFLMHCHPEDYEVYCFLRGCGCFYIEGNRYRLNKNDILIIRPREFHCFKLEDSSPYERCAMNFRTGDLSYVRLDKTLLAPFHSHKPGQNNLIVPTENDHVEDFIRRFDLCTRLPQEEAKPTSQFILGEFLTQIFSISRRNVLSIDYDNSNLLVNGILEYINGHITSRLTLEKLSEVFFVSKYYISHVFKKYTGVSTIEYIQRKKVLLASQMIKNGEKPHKVAERCGFSDYSTFYRAYRRVMGAAPSKKESLSSSLF